MSTKNTPFQPPLRERFLCSFLVFTLENAKCKKRDPVTKATGSQRRGNGACFVSWSLLSSSLSCYMITQSKAPVKGFVAVLANISTFVGFLVILHEVIHISPFKTHFLGGICPLHSHTAVRTSDDTIAHVAQIAQLTASIHPQRRFGSRENRIRRKRAGPCSCRNHTRTTRRR